MKLLLGVVEVPYSHSPKEIRARKAKARNKKTRAEPKSNLPDDAKTTGDVATILEAKYHIFETFAHRYQPEIAKSLESSLAGALENVLVGAPVDMKPFDQGCSEIENYFRQFLSNKEMDGNPGVPTMAALMGVSHRFKHPYARRPERPSFIDTGLMQASMIAEVEE